MGFVNAQLQPVVCSLKVSLNLSANACDGLYGGPVSVSGVVAVQEITVATFDGTNGLVCFPESFTTNCYGVIRVGDSVVLGSNPAVLSSALSTNIAVTSIVDE